MEGFDIIYIHDTDSDEEDLVEEQLSEDLVNAILSSAPVLAAARQANRPVRFSVPPVIDRVSGERSDKEKPDPSPITVRPIMQANPVDPAREMFRLEEGPEEPQVRLESPYNPSPITICAANSPPASQWNPASGTGNLPPHPSWDSDSDGKSPPVGQAALQSTAIQPKPDTFPLARRALRYEAPSTTHASPSQSTHDDDSDSDFTPGEKRKAKKSRPSTVDERPPQVQLRPMFDTCMALVWKRDHHERQRRLKSQIEAAAQEELPLPTYPPTGRRSEADAHPPPRLRAAADSGDRPVRQPRKAIGTTPQPYWGNHLTPTTWPTSIPQLASNYNPTKIRFPSVKPEGMCSYDSPRLGDCRYQTCKNARDGIFCDVYCCPFSGKCGNGRRELKSIRLMRVIGTDELTLQATERIEQGVVLGEYLGELSLETPGRSERADNEGFRLHFHRDQDAWGQAVVCVNALLAGSLMRFLNHSCAPCATFYEVGNGRQRTIVATTVRVIEAGEEITADYGDDLWFTCLCVRCMEAQESTDRK